MESDCVKIILLEGKFIGNFKSDLLPISQNADRPCQPSADELSSYGTGQRG